jgi:DNA-binding transcriptional regulator GbsR (MarR family)
VTAAKRKRLRPGELDGLVLAYMSMHEADGPLTASALAKSIGRSSGAIANCLRRLTKAKKVRQAKKAPRAYVVRKTRV